MQKSMQHITLPRLVALLVVGVLASIALALGSGNITFAYGDQALEEGSGESTNNYYPGESGFGSASLTLSGLEGQYPAATAQEAADNHVHVLDTAGIISDSAEEELDATIRRMILDYGWDIVIYTCTSLADYSSIAYYSAAFYEQNGYGVGSDISGMIMCICMDEANRGWYTAASGTCESYVTADTVNYVDDAIAPYMQDWDFDNALFAYLDEWDVIFSWDGSVPISIDWSSIILYALIAGIVFGFLSMRSKKRKMKTIALAEDASDYLVAHSLHLRAEHDHFTGVTVVRTPRARDDDDHHDRGGGPSSFGSFTSSGGHSFSGGGRSF